MLSSLLALMLATAGGFSSPAINECASLATHPDDPDRIAVGLEREDIDLQQAIAACQTAVQEAPIDPRSAYHLGRVLYYSGAKEEAMPWLETAAAAGYRQAAFVLGYVITLGEAAHDDFCRAAELWSRAASLGHPWSAFHLVEKSLDGKLSRCSAAPRLDELPKYMELARSQITVAASDGRVESLAARLIDHMKTEKETS